MVGSKRVAHYRFARFVVNRSSLLAVVLLAVTGATGAAQTRDAIPAGASMERAVLQAVNEARRGAGLEPLKDDAELAGTARARGIGRAS